MINNFKRLKIFYLMKLIRNIEQALIEKYHPEDKMRCPMHFCLGQELAPAVLGLLSKKNDSIYSNHRSHGYYIAKGGSIKKLIAEFYGKKTGTNGGLAGSQGLFSTDINLYSGAILSGAFSLSIGDAYSKIYKKQNSISIAMTGDGGMEEGIVYETFNFASKMKLPILFICENNLYSGHIH